MRELKYKVIPKGSAEGVIPLNLTFIDKKDIDEAGMTAREACELVAKHYGQETTINVMDLDAVTVTSDGIMAPGAVVAFASADHGKINTDFGFISVSEMPYSYELLEAEPHLKQWDVYYRGKRLYRGPKPSDKRPRASYNENMTITGRIANNNTGSEMMNLVEMTEILTPHFGMLALMQDDEVLVGLCGPEISVGIGMVVREHDGRIFDWAFDAGMTAHRSGVYAKTVKLGIPIIVGTKKAVAHYTILALEAGMVPGLHIGCSPAVLSIAKAMGYPIAMDRIMENAWIELESVGITREILEAPSEKLSREEVIARADEMLHGVENGKIYKVPEIANIYFAQF